MPTLQQLKINNSKNAAIKTGSWSNPGAKFYDRLLNAFYCEGDIPEGAKELEKKLKDGKYLQWNDFLKEAYLIAPVKDIKNSPYGVTPFSNSGCKYPHHEIRNGELVLSVPGVKAAYARAKQQGVYSGELKAHLERHMKELGELVNFEERIEDNFDYIYNYIKESTGINLFDNIEERFISEATGKDVDKSSDSVKKEKFVPIFGIAKSYSHLKVRNDGTPKSKSELNSIKFSKIINRLTRGDNYSHALVSFDDSFTKMYSYEDEGFDIDNIMENDSWMGTESIYICVMFVKKEDKKRMQDFVKYLIKNRNETKYASANLLKAFIATPAKVDKRFVCSTFSGYILSCSDPKNLHRDYSRLRPDDLTILPRAFYVMNVKDREEFIAKKSEIKAKVKAIYDEYYDEIDDYNNHLPKLMLQDRVDNLKFLDKIFDWIIDRM